MLQYHHCMPLDIVSYSLIKPCPEHADEDFKGAYSWLEKEIGFYPLFLAVGTDDEDIRMTGYQNQWRIILSEGNNGKEYQKKGDFPNYALFSFEEIDGVFMDYNNWHIALNAGHKSYQMTDYEKRLIFKPSWPKSKWLRKARKEKCSVQLAAPELYMPDAGRIWVRNRQSKELLASMGFGNVEQRRLLLEEPERKGI